MTSLTTPEGITFPPIDELLDTTDSKYSLVIWAAKRARQINAYYSSLGEGLLEYVGPLVETFVHEKPLSIALREINAGLLTAEKFDINDADAPPSDPNGTYRPPLAVVAPVEDILAVSDIGTDDFSSDDIFGALDTQGLSGLGDPFGDQPA